MTIAQYAKAIAAVVSAAATALGTAASDGVITTEEWVGVAIAAVLAGVAVYRVPNAPAPTDEEKALKAAEAQGFVFESDDYVGTHRAPGDQ